METVTLTRQELYDMVWNEPMIKLAKQYAISDVGLRKICLKMSIPLPKSGHWERVRRGIKVERFKLSSSYAGDNTVTLNIREEDTPPGDYSAFKEAREKIKRDPQLALTVPERLTNPDKLIVAAKAKLMDRSESGYGNADEMQWSGGDSLDIRVASQFVSRALRFMDFLIKTLKKRGHDIIINDGRRGSGTYAVVQGQEIRIYFREKLKRVKVIDSSWNRFNRRFNYVGE